MLASDVHAAPVPSSIAPLKNSYADRSRIRACELLHFATQCHATALAPSAPTKITIHDDARVQASACHVFTGPRTWLNHYKKCLTSCPHVALWRIDLADNWDSRSTLCFLYQVLRGA